MKKNTPKRRLASTRNMSKQDKRRVQLHKTTKNKTEQETRSGRVMFSRPDGSTLFVRGNRSEATVKTPLNKRLIALVLAIVMILALIPAGIFMLRPKAGSNVTPMEDTPMTVRINGVTSGTATIKPGDIATNISNNDIDYGDVTLPEGAEFVKAVLVDENNIETQIYSVASKTGTNYYSIAQDAYTGVAKDQDEKLVLIFANKYYVDFGTAVANADGSFENDGAVFRTNAALDLNTNKYFIYGGENLEIKEISSKTDHTVTSVSYRAGGNSGTERIQNSMVTIPSNMYAGDEIHVSVNYNEQNYYEVHDARYMNNSKYYAQYFKLDNHGGTSREADQKTGEDSLRTVPKGQSTTFYIYSQNNTTNQHVWRLSMLSINGVDMQFPKDEDALNVAVSSDFRDSDQVTVKRIADNENMGGSDNRTVYEVTVDNVHENLEVNYYFTDIKQRQIIIKGLNGINKTAASVENKMLTGNLTGKWYTYTTSKQNVYEAFYDSRKNYPADNLVLYTVKPGYNPYAISTTMYADGTDVTNAIRATQVTGTPVQVIKQAGNAEGGNFDTDWRYWGVNRGSNNGELINTDKKRWGDELLLTTLSYDRTNTWYAVALTQSQTTNQQLVLNAPEYPYSIEVNLDESGVLNDQNYEMNSDNNSAIENRTHRVSDASAYAFLPSAIPTRPGYRFAGYRMVDEEGKELAGSSDPIYQPSDRIEITDSTIALAYGDKTDSTNETVLKLRFNAKWKKAKDSTNVTIETSYQTGINNDGSFSYSPAQSKVEASSVGEAAIIDDHVTLNGNRLAESPYYVLSDDSVINASLSKLGDNRLIVKYNYNLLDLKITKEALGYPKTTRYEVTVILVPGENSPVSLDEVVMLLDKTGATYSIKDGRITYQRTIKDGDDFTVKVPYKWHYSVSEEKNDKDYSQTIEPNKEGDITDNTDITITNTSTDSGVGTNKYISYNENDGTYSITLESWTTGKTITKRKPVTTPLDVVLVVDQSGSMATTDMNPVFTPTEEKDWKVSDLESDTVYYYKPNPNMEEYYPVEIGSGTLYKNVGKPRVYSLIGSGHLAFTIGFNGAPTYYNIKSNYYYPDSNGVMRRVYSTSSGGFGAYYTYQYVYNNDEDAAYYENRGEWRQGQYWNAATDPWDSSDLRDNDGHILSNPCEEWISLYENNRFEWVHPSHNNADTTGDSIQTNWKFPVLLSVNNPQVPYDLYQIDNSSTSNRLYYVDNNGHEQPVGKKFINTVGETAYSGVLYTAEGESRVSALQTGVETFAGELAKHAIDNNVDHKLSIVGFAGNKTPALSTEGGIWHATPNSYSNYYDYVNTGLFLDGVFNNYKTVTSFSQTTNSFINRHYYAVPTGSTTLNTVDGKVPVVYRDDAWRNLGSTIVNNNTKYEANYSYLNDSQYANSLVSIKDNDSNENLVNDFVDDAINQFGCYGGTYTSYGMAMASKILEKAKEADVNNKRQRVVVVFTDGEPGSNGYDEAIANEALFESNAAKRDLDAIIYTVGLFPGYATTQVTDFMHKLSSDFGVAENEKVYASSLDPSQTYYYYDETEAKTFSLSTKKDGESSLGWWTTTTSNGQKVYTQYNVKSSDDDDMADTQLYKDSRCRDGGLFTADDRVYDNGDLDRSKTYYIKTSTTTGIPIKYEYRWYDSDNRVKEPKANQTDSESNHVQFFKLASISENDDGKDYYFKAKNARVLNDVFATISEQLSLTTTEVPLDDSNSLLRDIVTDKFSGLNENNITAKTVEGKYVNVDGERTLQWLDGSNGTVDTTANITITPSVSGNSLEVRGFNYGENYISEERSDSTNGKKLVITIDGLLPTENGFGLESNESNSGIYELLFEDDDNPSEQTGEQMLKEFSIPKVNRPKYSLVVEGDDKTTNYSVTFQLLKDGNPVSATDTLTNQPVVFNEGSANPTISSVNFTADGQYVWTQSATSGTEQSITFDNLPDGYSVKAIATKDTNKDNYDYSLKVIDGNGKRVVEPDPIFGETFALPQSGSIIKISSTRHTATITLNEQTLYVGQEGGSADLEKEFDIVLTLTDEDGHGISGNRTYSSIEFKNGVATIKMKHDQTRAIDLPEGFKLAIDVDPNTQDLYQDSYKLNDASHGSDEYPATPIANGQVITIINATDYPTPTGFSDSSVPVTAIILAVAGALGLGAVGAYVWRRKKFAQ